MYSVKDISPAGEKRTEYTALLLLGESCIPCTQDQCDDLHDRNIVLDMDVVMNDQTSKKEVISTLMRLSFCLRHLNITIHVGWLSSSSKSASA